jgi:hypothetical protein
MRGLSAPVVLRQMRDAAFTVNGTESFRGCSDFFFFFTCQEAAVPREGATGVHVGYGRNDGRWDFASA